MTKQCARCKKDIRKNSVRSIYDGHRHFCGSNCYRKYHNLVVQKDKHGTRR